MTSTLALCTVCDRHVELGPGEALVCPVCWAPLVQVPVYAGAVGGGIPLSPEVYLG